MDQTASRLQYGPLVKEKMQLKNTARVHFPVNCERLLGHIMID